jgi:membrane associated rhomboid family serine protease
MLTTYLLIAINVIVSLIAFPRMSTEAGSRTFLFSPIDVSTGRGYDKGYAGMILSHFSHADGAHLLFNMMTLFYFGPVVEEGLGPGLMLLIYAAGAVLSTLVVYYRHRNEPGYRSLGASDSVTAILFAAIVLLPGMSIGFILIPVPIPAPLFAIGYVVISTYLMQRGKGHISHEAHLAGAFVGLVLAGFLSPNGFEPLLRRFQWFLS